MKKITSFIAQRKNTVALILSAALILGLTVYIGSKMEYEDSNSSKSNTANTATTATKSDSTDGDTSTTTDEYATRQVPEPLSPIEKPRFELIDGVYINKNAEKTDNAVLMFAGDIMISYEQTEDIKSGKYDYNNSFNYIGHIFEQSDFAIANLETTLSHSSPYRWEVSHLEVPWGSAVNCNASPDFLDAVKISKLDALVTANNHCLDAGLDGINETLDHLDRYNFIHTGLQRGGGGGEPADDEFIIVDINGIKVAILSYVTGSLNSLSELYTEQELADQVNRYYQSAVKKNIKSAKENGAEYIIVFMHWGPQNTPVLFDSQIERAQQIADAGADYIVGSHPHVIQQYDIITADDGREVPCLYSMGNFLSGMNVAEDNLNRDSIIFRLELEKVDGVVRVADEGYIPCYTHTKYEGNMYVVIPSGDEYGGIVTDETVKSRERIQAALGDGLTIQLTVDN